VSRESFTARWPRKPGDWLQETLAGIPAKTPVVIALHHPPIALGNPPIDQLGLRDSQEFAEVLKQYPNIVAILVGHTHGATATTFAGRPLIVAPGIHSSLRFPWEDAQTFLDAAVAPAIAIHILDDDQRLTTHFRSIS